MPQQQAQPDSAFGAAASLLTGSTVTNASAVAKQSAAQQAAPSHRSPASRSRQQPDGAVNLWPELQWPARYICASPICNVSCIVRRALALIALKKCLCRLQRGAAAAQKAEQPRAQRPPGRLAAKLQKMRKEQAAPTSRQPHKRPTASTAAPSLAAKTSAPSGKLLLEGYMVCWAAVVRLPFVHGWLTLCLLFMTV